MSSLGLYTGLRGLNAARIAMQIAGHNVANANTPGYSRQRALFSTAFPVTAFGGFQLGNGVVVSNIERVLDERLEARIRTQFGLFGFAESDNRRMVEIEGILSESGDSGMAKLMNEFFGSISKLRTDAGSRSLRGGMLQGARSMTNAFNLLSDRYTSLRNDTLKEVDALLKDVNAHVENITELNTQIVTLEATGKKANDLRDMRGQSIKAISELLDTQAIERSNGTLDILAGGFLITSGGKSSTLRAVRNAAGQTEIRIGNSSTAIRVTQGKIAGILNSELKTLPRIIGQLDALANTYILEMNRIHSTGVSKKGPFTSLIAENAPVDGDKDGQFDDELLAFAGLPFDVVNGDLYIAVTDSASGDVQRSKISINTNSMTLGGFASAINSISHLSAVVDPSGKLRISAENGYGFDFSNRLDTDPNTDATLGGTRATLGGSTQGPYNFGTLPADFRVQLDGAAPPGTLITINATDFTTPSNVTPLELATVLNGKFSAAGLSMQALVVGDHVSLQASSSGTASSLRITDGAGSPMGLLGIPSGVTDTGQASGVQISVSGSYTGSANGRFRFVAEGTGQIGVTPGLTVGVFTANGTKIASLNIGEGYAPMDVLEVADGVKISFGPGSISATSNDQFSLDTLSDSDTSDVLVALGLNTFFTGSNAGNIGIAKRLDDDPALIAAGLSDSDGDSANLARMAALRDLSFATLTGSTIEEFYADAASDIGFETRKSHDLLVSQDLLLSFLENERDAVSGVNIDEEMVDLIRFQQAFQANSRFISVVNDMTQTLINLGR